MSKILTLSWQDIQHHTNELASLLKAKGPFEGIIAVSRGGLVPASLLANLLNLRWVDTVCLSSYDDQTQRDLQVIKQAQGDGTGCIVIDDLVDTGSTAQHIRSLYPNAHFVTLYAKPSGAPLVDQYVKAVDQTTWIVFPWENTPQTSK